ncbi:MAG: polysaccharide biosynthesis protein [Candidatus Izimaplasma sp.]|nr:polysaccharide biosynthesis protein [Candidatus Izimaplasma bacterium]
MKKIFKLTKNYFKNKSKINFMIIDVFGIAITYTIAIIVLRIYINTDFDYKMAFILLPFVIVFKILYYYLVKVYHLVLVNVGLDEVVKISIHIVFANIIIIIITLAIPNFEFIPEMFFIFTTLFEVFLAVTPRIIRRLIKLLMPHHYYLQGKRTLIIGAGPGGKIVLNEIRNNPQFTNNIICFVDDDDSKIGNLLSGFEIVGPIQKTPKFIDELAIQEVIIAISNIDQERFQEIVNMVSSRSVTIKRIPQLSEYNEDQSKKLLDVNVEDLLSRKPVKLDTSGINDFIEGKTILVTGAGGSIGSELVRQITNYNPKKVILFDIYENGVYDLQSELNINFSGNKQKTKTELLIGSVYNYKRLDFVFKTYKPDFVFHAAAYKHVPLMESSAVEAVRTNILGTYNVCKLSDIYEVQKFVLVSSDKAVRPTNVMGATKRFAEMIIQSFANKSKTSYSAVRFGNVLGSNGSVVPLFKRQIENGGPITITDKKIIRYFMTIPEASGLILQSAVYAEGGEIFILDMGEPVKILDLAEKMIMLSGLKPYEDIDIKVIGLRPGEKLFEELLVDVNNGSIKTDNEKIFIEKLACTENIIDEIEDILNKFEKLENLEVKRLIKKYVDAYNLE